MVQRDPWRDAGFQQTIHELIVEGEALGVGHGIIAVREDARPGDREAVGLQPKLLHQRHILGPAPVVIAGGLAVVAVGDSIVTSGHAGVFPPGLRVGQVTAVGEGGLIVQPHADLSRLEYVRILDFGMNGILQLPQRSADGVGVKSGKPRGRP